jgi:hypothetical protein
LSGSIDRAPRLYNSRLAAESKYHARSADLRWGYLLSAHCVFIPPSFRRLSTPNYAKRFASTLCTSRCPHKNFPLSVCQ